MGMKKSEKEIVARQRELGKLTSEALQDFKTSGGFQRFAPGPLQTAMPQLQGSATFLGGAPSPYAQSLAYQALPGMTYANRPGTTTAFYPQANVAPPAAAIPPATGGAFQRSEPVMDSGRVSDPADIERENELLIAELVDQAREMDFERQDELRDAVRDFEIAKDIRRGPFQIEDYDDIFDNENLFVSRNAPEGILSLQELRNLQDSIGDNVMMTMADGGIANIPVRMQGGGILGALGSLGSAAMTGMGKIGSAVGSGLNRLSGNQESEEDKKSPYENMTREQLIALLEKDRKVDVGAGLSALSRSLMPQQLADGGDVDFPRMNGPISGPGTETSDDIPAMLSDGEFVVNAKAVRGVGKLNGAGKSKSEQRREGARMMYALQKAGEQAMRKA